MAIVIRMSRNGRTNRSHFRVGVYDRRSRRDGEPIEQLGHYDPLVEDRATNVVLDLERIGYWLSQGAYVSETVKSFLKRRGVKIPPRGKNHPSNRGGKPAGQGGSRKSRASKPAGGAAKPKKPAAKGPGAAKGPKA
jgi:small subunit ribosomal protein S16